MSTSSVCSRTDYTTFCSYGRNYMTLCCYSVATAELTTRHFVDTAETTDTLLLRQNYMTLSCYDLHYCRRTDILLPSSRYLVSAFPTQYVTRIHAYCYTVEPLNEDTFGTNCFVLCKDRGCPLSEVIFYRVCIQEYFRLILRWEVCHLSECPSSL